MNLKTLAIIPALFCGLAQAETCTELFEANNANTAIAANFILNCKIKTENVRYNSTFPQRLVTKACFVESAQEVADKMFSTYLISKNQKLLLNFFDGPASNQKIKLKIKDGVYTLTSKEKSTLGGLISKVTNKYEIQIKDLESDQPKLAFSFAEDKTFGSAKEMYSFTADCIKE
ncbi:MAG: hypothetical protein COW00_02175 [Bdellovibrio sp. CG12_big_fil_rev_8_21_14_0_65_39_13]|nr:MAG: hypothetical protein COW78_14430 [Bdellovibrio sp. CG22_combo_CG10-13_8_21_14_all_39_27]PIQ62189.1 MAG: hypothetical protein COW00_02175 [Bdellovibrio sp. CG12_big_fil_rev_8_21_14_0_65_39_13]PIR34199.1 MAG: hypothetical protein COV37_13920 [Bdellovibrio sp. CG11_big_fil_rev_8_21_14_0_20_39_38]PJB52622.1 MAG: hypothetical protein CO099_11640 [Bdellovibrio sp. CG_4_9_14_3_um_filter_39_7]